MTTIDALVKNYKAGLKESQNVLAGLEEQAREMAAMEDTRHDAELAFEDTQSQLGNVAADKDTIKDELSEALLTGDGDVDGLRERYAELAAEEDRLRERMGDLTKSLEDSTVDRKEVARIRAQLRRVSNRGSELLDSVKKTVQADTASLSERVAAVEGKLPPADDLDTLYALGFTEKADGYRQAIERNEAIRPGSGDQMRDVLHREVQRVLAKV